MPQTPLGQIAHGLDYHLEKENLALAPGHKKRILVVDDDQSVREVMKILLESGEFLVDCASNGQEALEYLETHEIPALILLNLKMPVMDGFEFAEKLKRNPRIARIPIVISSGAYEFNWMDYVVRTGAKAFLRRPQSNDELFAIVRHYCS
jgi:CheY-like chemotaxis protein